MKMLFVCLFAFVFHSNSFAYSGQTRNVIINCPSGYKDFVLYWVELQKDYRFGKLTENQMEFIISSAKGVLYNYEHKKLECEDIPEGIETIRKYADELILE